MGAERAANPGADQARAAARKASEAAGLAGASIAVAVVAGMVGGKALVEARALVDVARVEGMSNATTATVLGTSPETALSHDAQKVAARDLAVAVTVAYAGKTAVLVTDVVFATIELECAATFRICITRQMFSPENE